MSRISTKRSDHRYWFVVAFFIIQLIFATVVGYLATGRLAFAETYSAFVVYALPVLAAACLAIAMRLASNIHRSLRKTLDTSLDSQERFSKEVLISSFLLSFVYWAIIYFAQYASFLTISPLATLVGGATPKNFSELINFPYSEMAISAISGFAGPATIYWIRYERHRGAIHTGARLVAALQYLFYISIVLLLASFGSNRFATFWAIMFLYVFPGTTANILMIEGVGRVCEKLPKRLRKWISVEK